MKPLLISFLLFACIVVSGCWSNKKYDEFDAKYHVYKDSCDYYLNKKTYNDDSAGYYLFKMTDMVDSQITDRQKQHVPFF